MVRRVCGACEANRYDVAYQENELGTYTTLFVDGDYPINARAVQGSGGEPAGRRAASGSHTYMPFSTARRRWGSWNAFKVGVRIVLRERESLVTFRCCMKKRSVGGRGVGSSVLSDPVAISVLRLGRRVMHEVVRSRRGWCGPVDIHVIGVGRMRPGPGAKIKAPSATSWEPRGYL